LHHEDLKIQEFLGFKGASGKRLKGVGEGARIQVAKRIADEPYPGSRD
jgi:hypothetical protein